MDEQDKSREAAIKIGWQDSLWWGICLIILYLLLTVLPVILVVAGQADDDDPLLVQIGLAGAMVGFLLICMQVLLAGRFKTINRPFGLDVLMRFHKKMGIIIVVLLVGHPILIALGHQSWHLFGFDTSWRVDLGKAALFLLVLGVLFAVFFKRLRVDYNIWRFSHKAMVIVIILGFLHGLYIGPDIQNGPLRIYWFIIFTVTSFVFLYRNLLVPLWIRRRFKVTDVKKETHDTYTLTFRPQDGRPTYRNPGQFMFLKLIRKARLSQIHPFTISASPFETGILQATIKKSGNFTSTIDQTRIGDKAGIEAPFGRFSLVYHNPAKILFIAGGVGITPVMSMIRFLRDTGDKRPVVLIYGNKTADDIILRNELEELPDNFKVVHVLEHADENWQGQTGYITCEIIEKFANEILQQAHIYLCGPPIMMNKIIKILRSKKIEDRRIHYERFTI